MRKFFKDLKEVGIDCWCGFVWCVQVADVILGAITNAAAYIVVFMLRGFGVLGRGIAYIANAAATAGENLGNRSKAAEIKVLRGSERRRTIENCVAEDLERI